MGIPAASVTGSEGAQINVHRTVKNPDVGVKNYAWILYRYFLGENRQKALKITIHIQNVPSLNISSLNIPSLSVSSLNIPSLNIPSINVPCHLILFRMDP